MTTQRVITACCLSSLLAITVGCCAEVSEELRSPDGTIHTPKIGHFPMRSEGPKTLDPVKGSTVYENRCVSQIMETLVQYKYLKRPFELEALLLTEMPTTEDDLTWNFTLRDDVYFHDSPCFPDGKGRKLVSSDVFYSWKRMADSSFASIRDTLAIV